MLKICSIYKSYKGNEILKNIDLSINNCEIAALIGPNGTGKTTLLNVIAGKIEPDSGTIIRDRVVVGFVSQTPESNSLTVKNSFEDKIEEWEIDIALERVGLSDSVKNQRCSSLSGGQQTRLAFARILVTKPKPNLLILDEPTNNLDLEGLKWLENFVQTFQGAVIFTSHDRSFINATATKIIAINKKTVQTYTGNYDFFVEESNKEKNAQLKKFQLQQAEKKKIESLIKKAKEGAKKGVRKNKPPDNDKFLWTFKNEHVQKSLAGTAKSLETKLEKIEDYAVEKPSIDRRYSINFDTKNHRNKFIVSLENISKQYGDKKILNRINLQIRGNERIRIKGPNGSGKTTFLKIACEILKPDEGFVILGEDIKVGYYSQTIDGLNHSLNGLENIMENLLNVTDAYSKSASMGLSPEHLKMNISELSVGQRAKLSIIKLLGRSNHLLILDEPTNHLDIATREAIENALQSYEGSILVASHDEYFVKKLKIDKTIQLNTV